jgi:PAS domain S-box-containing protein
MNFQEKTKEELIASLLELQLENRVIKQSLEKSVFLNAASLEKDPSGQREFRDTKEHFELFFNNSPDAVLITRLSDGIVVEANQGFAKLSGYTREETLGFSSIDFQLWKNPADRQQVVNELLKHGFCEDYEAEYLRKDSSSFVGSISARSFILNGIPHIFSRIQNVTERKASEQAQRRSDEKFRLLFANLIDGSALHSLLYDDQGIPVDYTINEVNPAYETLLGISRESVVNKSSKEAYGVDQPPYFEIFSKVALSGNPEVFETYFAPLDKYLSISVYCPFIGSFATIFEDITKRRKAEQELRVVLTKYQVLFDIFPVGITVTDPVGKIIESNPIAETLLGISVEEQESRKIDGEEWRIIRPDGETMPVSEFASVRALAEKRQVTNVEMGIVKGNKQITWLNVSASPVPIEGYGVVIVYSDISERKRVEIEREKTQKLLEDSQRIGKIGGWELNMDSQELKWTREMYHIHEVEMSFEPKVTMRELFYAPESLPYVLKSMQQAIENGNSYEVDSEIITAKGNHKSVKEIGKADLENRRVYGLFQDITERKKAELALQDSEAKLRELNATKDKFFAIIAHDLKSPFNGILGFSEILRDEARDLDIDSIVAYTDIIYSTAKQTLKLLENLLDWAGMQRGGFHHEPKKIIVNNLIEDEIGSLIHYANQKSILIYNGVKEEIVVTADEKMISTVLRNLISNAIKFTPRNGKITIDVNKTKDQVEVSISDTGVGMEQKSIEQLFKIETSFSSRGTENEKGTGLGLLLCKEFVEKHGGKIWVISEKDKGSTFAFTLPIGEQHN